MARTYLKNNDAHGLSEFLEKGDVKSLNLKARSLDSENAEVLAKVLKTNKTLLEINLSDNMIEAEGLKIICAAMEENSTLIALDLGDNKPDGLLHVDAIAKMVAVNKTLKILNVNYSNINMEGMPILAEALKENHTLTELNLGYNFCGSKGVKALSEMLDKNSTLKALDLSGNLIGSECSSLIADYLKTNTTLTELNLDFNHLVSNGAIPILNALKNNTTLKTLHLATNRLDEESAKHIGSLLRKNNTLSALDFGGNRLFWPSDTADVKAIDYVVQGLEGNTSIVNLKLTENHLSEGRMGGKSGVLGPQGQQRAEDMRRINNLLQRNRTFEALAEKDAGLCTRLFPGHLLSMDEGKVLAGAMIMAAPSTAAYEEMMVQSQCSLNVLASQT